MGDQISRRDLLQKSGMIAVGLTAPAWLSSIAKADVIKRAAGGKVTEDGILVVCQLNGGNDGLNTVIPYTDPKYYELRPTLGVPADKVLRLNDKLGLNPVMGGIETLYKEGKVAIIQNVGYPRPNRSHFRSMDIWNQGSPEDNVHFGWVGRHLDLMSSHGPLNPVYALGLSTEKPRALNAENVSVPCFASLADIQAMVGDPDAERMLREISSTGSTPAENVVAAANRSAFDAMAALRDQLKNYDIKQTYGKDRFGQGFAQISKLLATTPQTRVVYFSAGGFDTHARQDEAHGPLLQGFSDAVLAFMREMEAVGKADKIVLLVFSEFGRRSYENSSKGTDHGAAAPMFLVGKPVKGGFYGSQPNLMDLADGDLKFGIDFRQVYASALDQWMGGDSQKVLAGKFEHVPFLG